MKVVGWSGPFFLADDLYFGLFLHHQRVRRDAGGQEDIRPDGAAFAHYRVASHDRGARVNGHVVFESGMPLLPAELLAGRERLRHQAHALIHLNVAADDGGLADDRARAVVHEEM